MWQNEWHEIENEASPLLGKWRYVETSKARGYIWMPGPPNLFRHLPVYEIFCAQLVEG